MKRGEVWWLSAINFGPWINPVCVKSAAYCPEKTFRPSPKRSRSFLVVKSR